jgi:hypothetical protein
MVLGAINSHELSNYRAGSQRLGAYQVPLVDQVIKGNVVQVGNGVHTYIVVANFGGGNLDVVDSNHSLNGIVQHYVRNYKGEAAISDIWRLGRA